MAELKSTNVQVADAPLFTPNTAAPFKYGDNVLAQTIQGGTPVPNELPDYYIESGDGLSVTNMDNVYYDIDRKEKKTLIRNGEEYNWSWMNPDKRFIELYTPGRNQR